MITPTEYQALKAELTALEKEAAEATGALAQLRKRLKEEFGCATLSQAKAKLAELKSQAKKLEEEVEHATQEFERWIGKRTTG